MEKDMKLEYYGFDCGNGYSKLESDGTEIVFKTGVELSRNTVFESNYDNALSMDGKNYIVGLTRRESKENKAEDMDMLLCLMLGIAYITKKKKRNKVQHVVIGMGSPIIHASEFKESYIKYFKGKRCQFSYMGEEYDITIDYVFFFQQGIAAITANYATKIKPLGECVFFDMGMGTTDTGLILYTIDMEGRSKVQITELDSFDIGADYILKEIRRELRNESANISDEMLERAIRSEKITCARSEEISQLAVQIATAYVSDFVARMKKRYNMGLPIVAQGGTYLLLKEYLDEKGIEPAVIFDQFENARSFRKLAELKMNKNDGKKKKLS